MKNEDFLDLLNEIDEKYIESANKRLEELHQYEDPEFGKALKPQVIRLEISPKKLISLRNVAFATVAAAIVCTVTTGVFVKLNKPQTSSPNSGVTLSESSSESEPTSSEPTVFEPAISEERMKRVQNEGYNFALEIFNDKDGLSSGPFLKRDSEKGITIIFACSDECEGRRFTIEFYSYNSQNKTADKSIATLTFTARTYTQSFNILYDENELKKGDECIMVLCPEDRDYKSHAAVKGSVLP